MDRKKANRLLNEYTEGRATPEGHDFIESWYNRAVDEQPAVSGMTDWADAKRTIWQRLVRQRRTRRLSLRVLPYAAAALLFALAAAWVFFADTDRQHLGMGLAATDIAPGGNRATLTLADGRTIDLSEAQSGIVIGDAIVYADGTEISEAGKEPLMADGSHPMSLTTPKGGTYRVTLSDGSKVWLNAASTLKYPSQFTASERTVELEGEAYFDVSEQWSVTGNRSLRDKTPFLVKTSSQTVEVLGTQFNIAAYGDNAETRTTLVEGSVRVAPTTGHRPPVIIKPGQQAIMRGAAIEVAEVDPEDAVAWKNGYFMFSSERLERIMAKLARWYDVDVVFTDEALKDETFFGSISRYENIAEVLSMLRATEVATFRVQGRQVIVQRTQQ